MQTFVKVGRGCLIGAATAVVMVSSNGQPVTATAVLDATPIESGLIHQQRTPKSHSYSLKDSGSESSHHSRPAVKALASIWEKHIIGLAGAYMVIVLLTLINMLQNLLALRFPSHK